MIRRNSKQNLYLTPNSADFAKKLQVAANIKVHRGYYVSEKQRLWESQNTIPGNRIPEKHKTPPVLIHLKDKKINQKTIVCQELLIRSHYL